MQAMHRQYGRITHKSSEDDSKVNVLLQDYANAEKVLTSIVESSKTWRESWISTLTAQLGMIEAFEELYNPIIGTAGETSTKHQPVDTPQSKMDRTSNLKQAYAELRTDLMTEVQMVDTKIIRPANDAREFIKPIKNTIKARENKRLDYETFKDRLESRRKAAKSDKDEQAVMKLEQDVARSGDQFQYADAHLRETLPPVIQAAFKLLPHLLAALTITQNTLLAQYYTKLHNFCTDYGIPSPPPPVQDVVTEWQHEFTEVQQEIESWPTIARGKTIHTPLHPSADAGGRQGSTLTGFNLRNNLASRRTASATHSGARTPTGGPPINESRRPSYNQQQSDPAQSPQYSSQNENQATYSQQYTSQQTHLAPVQDYFQGSNVNNQERPQALRSVSSQMVIGKKKPPPPPPAKRIPSAQHQFVTALYDFDGQEGGDLSFREGDRIKVVKRTGSLDDWWDGELNGTRGRFPANYVQV